MEDVFVHYNSPDEYANAFQQMIDAREKWREQIRQQPVNNLWPFMILRYG